MAKATFVFIFLALFTMMPSTSNAYCPEYYHLNGAKSAISALVQSIYCNTLRPSVDRMRNILRHLQHHQLTLPSSSCPSGWSQLYNSCFKVFNRAMTWKNGLATCKKHRAVLAIIKNDAESEYVLSLVHRVSGKHMTAWIGYNDRKRNHRWVWNDDTKHRHGSRWYPGHPDYSSRSSTKNCAYIGQNTSRWKDSSCNVNRIVVCVKSKK